MAEAIPPLTVSIIFDTSSITAGVQKASSAMKQLTNSANKDISKLRDGFEAFGKTATRYLKIATLALSAFVVKLGKDAVQAAMEDEKSQALLANALRNTTGATSAAIAGVEDYITALQKTYSVADDELRPALAKLVSATGSVTTGQELMSRALNISAFAGTDLASASDAIIKATRGQFKALQLLVPGIDLTAVKSKDLIKIFKEVDTITSGSASTRANTFQYRIMGLKIAFQEMLETLGYQLIPVLESFVSTIQTKILPQVETWIALNKGKLAEGLKKAADATLKLVIFSAKFGAWVVDNIELIKSMALILAGIWATSKVYAFAKAIGAVTLAFRGMAGAATAAAAAEGAAVSSAGAISAIPKVGVPGLVLSSIPFLTYGLSKISPGEKRRAKEKETLKKLDSYLPKSPGPSDIRDGLKIASTITPTKDENLDWLKKITEELKKANATSAKKDKVETVQNITVYATNTNDIYKKLSKAAKNGTPIGAK